MLLSECIDLRMGSYRRFLLGNTARAWERARRDRQDHELSLVNSRQWPPSLVVDIDEEWKESRGVGARGGGGGLKLALLLLLSSIYCATYYHLISCRHPFLTARHSMSTRRMVRLRKPFFLLLYD